MDQTNYFDINYAYLCGALTAKLKFIAYDLDAAGLLKKDAIAEAEKIVLKAVAEAEQAERKFTTGA